MSDCGTDHEGPCVSLPEALYAGARDDNSVLLFAILADMSTEELDEVENVGRGIAAAATAMKHVQASHGPDELQEALGILAAMTAMTGMAGLPDLPEKPEDVNDFLASLGLATEDGTEPEQKA